SRLSGRGTLRSNQSVETRFCSIASNIAEGYGKSSKGEYLQFLGHARGSCAEVETQLTIANELGFGAKAALSSSNGLCDEVGKMLVALMKSLRTAKPLKN